MRTPFVLVLAALLSSCLPADRRDLYTITDWTLNAESCEAEGADVRAGRVDTHLLVNPLGGTGDEEAIVTSCVRAPGSRDCATKGHDLDFDAEVSFRMQRQADGSWTASRSVLDESATCAGHVEHATLTFPIAQRFRLEIRRSHFDVAAPADCIGEASEQAAANGCTELEVLHGDFEIVVEAEHESSGGGDDDDDWD